MNLPARKTILTISLFSAAMIALSGCGRRGPLEPHPDAPAAQSARPQPDGEGARPQTRPALGGSRRTLSSAITPPQKPFILDPLL